MALRLKTILLLGAAVAVAVAVPIDVPTDASTDAAATAAPINTTAAAPKSTCKHVLALLEQPCNAAWHVRVEEERKCTENGGGTSSTTICLAEPDAEARLRRTDFRLRQRLQEQEEEIIQLRLVVNELGQSIDELKAAHAALQKQLEAPPSTAAPKVTPKVTPSPAAQRLTPHERQVLAQQLMKATEGKDVQEMKQLIEDGADLKYQNPEDGWTPQHWAAGYGHADLLRVLIEADAPLDVRTKTGHMPIHLAAHQGHVDSVRLLAAAGANLNVQDRSGQTPLHWAAKNNHLEAVKVLLKYGADASIVDNLDEMPLDLARSDDMYELLQPAEPRRHQWNSKK